MRVLVASMIRDGDSYVARYFEQMKGLRSILEGEDGSRLRVALIEDFSRGEPSKLVDEACHEFVNSVHVKVSDECQYYPSHEVHAPRWRHISWVANHAFEQILTSDTHFMFVHSDLTWDPFWVATLLRRVDESTAWAAGLYHARGFYYDTWGTRAEGVNFEHAYPHHPRWTDGPIEVDSVTGCLATTARHAKRTRFTPGEADVGWCRQLRGRGVTIMLDPEVRVVHP